MTNRISLAVLPAALFALGLTFAQAPVQANETAMVTDAPASVSTGQVEDAHRWGD